MLENLRSLLTVSAVLIAVLLIYVLWASILSLVSNTLTPVLVSTKVSIKVSLGAVVTLTVLLAVLISITVSFLFSRFWLNWILICYWTGVFTTISIILSKGCYFIKTETIWLISMFCFYIMMLVAYCTTLLYFIYLAVKLRETYWIYFIAGNSVFVNFSWKSNNVIFPVALSYSTVVCVVSRPSSVVWMNVYYLNSFLVTVLIVWVVIVLSSSNLLKMNPSALVTLTSTFLSS